MPYYQTTRLGEYREDLAVLASRFFQLIRERVAIDRAVVHPGSYSVLAASTDETTAKILVYEEGKGQGFKGFPALRDGVYALIRVNGNAAAANWDGRWKEKYPRLFRRLNRRMTIGVAPSKDERFAFFLIRPADDLAAIADLFVDCGTA